MPDFSLNWTARSSTIKCIHFAACPPEGGPAEAEGFICLCLTPERTRYKVNDTKVNYKEGRGRSGPSIGSSPAGLCWWSSHLVQRGPDEPSWTWTQIWVQAWMLDYSLKWTARSCVIQGWQRCQWCRSHTWRWPSRSHGPFSFKSAIEHWLSSTDARQYAEKSLRKAVADWASAIILSERFI